MHATFDSKPAITQSFDVYSTCVWWQIEIFQMNQEAAGEHRWIYITRRAVGRVLGGGACHRSTRGYPHFRAVYLCPLTVAANVCWRLVRLIIRLLLGLGGNALKSAFPCISVNPKGRAGLLAV